MALLNTSQSRLSLEGVALLPASRQTHAIGSESVVLGVITRPVILVLNYLDASDDVFFVVEGSARVILYSDAGKVVSFCDLGPGDTFGEIPAIDGGPRSASVEARTDCVVASMPGLTFCEILQSEPVVTQALLRQQVGAIRRLTTRVQEFSAAVMAITGRGILRRDLRHPGQGHLPRRGGEGLLGRQVVSEERRGHDAAALQCHGRVLWPNAEARRPAVRLA